MSRLFRLKSIVNAFSHRGSTYDNVEISWFVVHRDTSTVSHKDLLNGYLKDQEDSLYISEENVYELFTEEEADAFKQYLFKAGQTDCRMREADMRFEINSWGYGDKILSYREGYYRLDHEDGYNLPFVVWGYYDLSYAKDVTWSFCETESAGGILHKLGMTVNDVRILETKTEKMKNQELSVVQEGGHKQKVTN